jgi:hypothetical protein
MVAYEVGSDHVAKFVAITAAKTIQDEDDDEPMKTALLISTLTSETTCLYKLELLNQISKELTIESSFSVECNESE